jgi:hypothetical protein
MSTTIPAGAAALATTTTAATTATAAPAATEQGANSQPPAAPTAPAPGGSDAAAGAAAIGTDPSSLIAVLQQLVETLNALVALLMQSAMGGGPKLPGTPGQHDGDKDPGQGPGFPGQQSSVGGASGAPTQTLPGIWKPTQGSPGQSSPGQTWPGQGSPAQGSPAQGSPGQGAPNVPQQGNTTQAATHLGALNWWPKHDEAGAREARATTSTGQVVTVVRDAQGGYRLATPTGRAESVPIDGKILRFDEAGRFLRAGVSLPVTTSTAQLPLPTTTTTTQQATTTTAATPSVPANGLPPASQSGGTHTAPPAPGLGGALPPTLPA